MTTQNKNAPTLRFPEFVEDWEEKKLSEVSKINPNSQKLPDSFVYIDLESVENGVLLKEISINLIGAPSRAQRVLVKNDILFQMVRPYQKNNLFFEKDGNYVASTGYAQIRTENDAKYLFQYLHTDYFVNDVLDRCTGTSYPAINSTDLSNIVLKFPTLPEQKKVAAFLTAVDQKIQQLTKKKDLLEQYKKGVMQKIFNQEIRFKDDNGNNFADWEEKSLGNMIDLVVDNRGKTPPVISVGFPLLEVNSVGSRYINYSVVKKFVDENTFNTWFRKHLKKGDILFSTVGNTALCSIYEGEISAGIAQNLVGLRFEKEYYLFMYYLITEKRNNHKFKEIEMSAVQPSVKVSQMIHLTFSVPTLREQQKIANFLSAIDEKINLVNQQLEKTKEYKKGLLQQMFV